MQLFAELKSTIHLAISLAIAFPFLGISNSAHAARFIAPAKSQSRATRPELEWEGALTAFLSNSLHGPSLQLGITSPDTPQIPIQKLDSRIEQVITTALEKNGWTPDRLSRLDLPSASRDVDFKKAWFQGSKVLLADDKQDLSTLTRNSRQLRFMKMVMPSPIITDQLKQNQKRLTAKLEERRQTVSNRSEQIAQLLANSRNISTMGRFSGAVGDASDAPASYDPAIWNQNRLSDSRYVGLIRSAPKILFGEKAPLPIANQPSPARNMVESMRSFDEGTYAHMLRVGLVAGLLALRLGLPAPMANRIVWTATLHDIGKRNTEIRDIIHLPRRLDSEEQRMMEQHTVIGAKELLMMPGISDEFRLDAAEVALNHHETPNGKGYPNQRTGEDIPLQAMITSAADVLDALMDKRAYSETGRSLEESWKIIREHFSQSFYPPIFRSLRDLVGELIASRKLSVL
ncbi:MAG: hypothetical protein COB53_06875 [Elusimicrobia bacterium]|nr:MAG: hypothetical protein COB53_06875 [Elusimicrobiota bacterium]